MRINHNISALKANNLLNLNDSKLSKNLEKLTSGLKINHASDDAAGMAISQKMKTQISGLSKASNNASDGISVIQTAEGALEEVNSCLQRMRELSVQAANGIYTAEDRTAIQKEIDALNSEITRISETTEFNTRNLLDGSIDRKSFSNSTNVSIVSVSDSVPTADGYKIKITQDARQAVLVGDKLDGITDISQKVKHTEAGKININGLDIKVEEGDTYDEVFKKLRDTCADLDIYCFATDADIQDDTTNYGEDVYAGYRAEKFGVGATGESTDVFKKANIITTTITNFATDQAVARITINNTTYEGEYTNADKTLTVSSGPDVGKKLYITPNASGVISEIEIFTPTTTPYTSSDITISDSSADFSSDIDSIAITLGSDSYTGAYTFTDHTIKLTSPTSTTNSTNLKYDKIEVSNLTGSPSQPTDAAYTKYTSSAVIDATSPVTGSQSISSISNLYIGSTTGTIKIGSTTYTGTVTKASDGLIKLTNNTKEINIHYNPLLTPTSVADALTAEDINSISISSVKTYVDPEEITPDDTEANRSYGSVFDSSLEPGKDKFLSIQVGDNKTTYTGTLIQNADSNSMTLRSYNGKVFDITTTPTEPKKIKKVVERNDIQASQRLAFVTSNYGSDESISILCNNPELSKLFGLSTNTLQADGIDAKADLLANPDNGYSNTATVSIYGNKITVSDNNNFEMVIETAPGTAKTTFKDNIIDSSINEFASLHSAREDVDNLGLPVLHTATFTVLDAGPLSLQIGANAYQTMEVSIPAVTPKILGVDTVNVGTEKGAQKAITAVSDAINTISSIRAKLGAFQNRLEHAISNLDTTNENLTESLSRVEDTDMAEEMASYTQHNILVQSGVAMLANANQQPQNILSLIQR